MGWAATAVVMALVWGADTPLGERTQPGGAYGAPAAPGASTGHPERTAPQGVFNKPIRRYTEVLYDFLAPPPLTPTVPGMPPTPPGSPTTLDAAAVAPGEPVLPPAPPAAADVGPPDAPPPPELPMAPVQFAKGSAQAGGESLPALCLHPEGLVPATVTFPWVWVRPLTEQWPRVFLVFKVGLADPLVEPELPLEPALSTLTVTMAGRLLHSEDVRERKWQLRVVDVTDFAGQMGDVVFQASTMNSQEKQAVICVAQPRLIEEQGIYFLSPGGRELNFGFSLSRFPRGQGGVAFAQVQASAESKVELGLGDTTAEFTVAPGTQWLPLEFARPGRFSFRRIDGDAELLRLDVAPAEPEPPQPKEQQIPTPPGT